MTFFDIIERLSLQPHPEGGYYRETYRSAESIKAAHLPGRFNGDRAISTGIYYLLSDHDFSGFHRILSDETWHHYAGEPLHIYTIDNKGTLNEKILGSDLMSGQEPQYTVPAGCWFAAHVSQRKGFSFIGCTVAPGFDFHDFEMGVRDKLLQYYPDHKEIISSLTR